jgi:hypothetical protein
MPMGLMTWSLLSGHTWPARLWYSSVWRGGESRGLGGHSCVRLGLVLPMTFSRVLISSAMLMGGLGRALLVRMGGLTRRGVVEP